MNTAVIDSYNATLPDLAKEAGAMFIPLPVMPEHHTRDGIHLNEAGYEVWDKAILQESSLPSANPLEQPLCPLSGGLNSCSALQSD